MKVKERIKNFMEKRSFRWYLSAGVSFLFSFAFAIYNLIVGVVFRLVWNFSVCFYYLLLMAIKGIILYCENKWKTYPKELRQSKRLTLFKVENIFLLMIDMALAVPVILLILQRKVGVDIGMIPAIAAAAYTTYKIVMACMHYRHTKKEDNLALHGLKLLSLKETIVSIITLQNTMVIVFGDAAKMQTLTAWTTAGMYALVVALSVFAILKGKKKRT